jgi:rifampin ADP-ribosylating transferase
VTILNRLQKSQRQPPTIWVRSIVEPTGPMVDDPNLTDKKFPGNPTKSYRSREPLRVTGEVTDWQGHSPEALKAMKDGIERLRQLGVEAIDD